MHRLLLVLLLALAGTASSARASTCTPGPFRVFFDWQSDALVGEAEQILTFALQVRERCETTRILVSGHSDTSEAADMGSARARTVDRWLMSHGIAPGDIRVETLGSTRPRIETGPDIREIQNRRVEITFPDLSSGLEK